MSDNAKIGVIGGSGIYEVDGLSILSEKAVSTPFGDPSDTIRIGRFDEGAPMAFLPRHGKGHRILPAEVNSRANIWAMKSLGVNMIVSLSAVGSLKKEISPKDIVIPDQLIDRTRMRKNTFFGEGIVGHVGFADPFCPELSSRLYEKISQMDVKIHKNETYVCMEGPAFSTRAESNLYRSWGAGIIGMTALPEAKLAREAEICYAVVAFATDYDCWYEEEEDVSVEMVLENFRANTEKAQIIIKDIIAHLPEPESCRCATAALGAIMTRPSDLVPAETRKKIDLLYGKYL